MRQSCSVYENVLKCTLMKRLPVCIFVMLEQYFSTWSIVAHQGTVGNIQRHFWLSQLEEGGTGIQWVETRDAAKHPRMQGAASTRKDAQTQR